MCVLLESFLITLECPGIQRRSRPERQQSLQNAFHEGILTCYQVSEYIIPPTDTGLQRIEHDESPTLLDKLALVG